MGCRSRSESEDLPVVRLFQLISGLGLVVFAFSG